jgi:hypothetical protein
VRQLLPPVVAPRWQGEPLRPPLLHPWATTRCDRHYPFREPGPPSGSAVRPDCSPATVHRGTGTCTFSRMQCSSLSTVFGQAGLSCGGRRVHLLWDTSPRLPILQIPLDTGVGSVPLPFPLALPLFSTQSPLLRHGGHSQVIVPPSRGRCSRPGPPANKGKQLGFDGSPATFSRLGRCPYCTRQRYLLCCRCCCFCRRRRFGARRY